MKHGALTKILLTIWVWVAVYFMVISIVEGVMALFLGAFLSGFMISLNIGKLTIGVSK